MRTQLKVCSVSCSRSKFGLRVRNTPSRCTDATLSGSQLGARLHGTNDQPVEQHLCRVLFLIGNHILCSYIYSTISVQSNLLGKIITGT